VITVVFSCQYFDRKIIFPVDGFSEYNQVEESSYSHISLIKRLLADQEIHGTILQEFNVLVYQIITDQPE